MNSSKEKIKDFAKDLFLQVNPDGNKIHTWDSISKSILKKFKLEIHFTTIQKWSKKEDWAATFEKIKMAGIELGKEQLQEKENKLIDEKSTAIADIYKSNRKLHKIAQQILLSRLTGIKAIDLDGNELKSEINSNDLIKVLQHSEATVLSLHDKGTLDNSNDKKINFKPISFIKSNGQRNTDK